MLLNTVCTSARNKKHKTFDHRFSWPQKVFNKYLFHLNQNTPQRGSPGRVPRSPRPCAGPDPDVRAGCVRSTLRRPVFESATERCSLSNRSRNWRRGNAGNYGRPTRPETRLRTTPVGGGSCSYRPTSVRARYLVTRYHPSARMVEGGGRREQIKHTHARLGHYGAATGRWLLHVTVWLV